MNVKLSRHPNWAQYAVVVWSLIYGILGSYWAMGGAGFPFGENDPRGHAMGSFLADLRADTGGAAVIFVGVVGTAVALAMLRKWRNRIIRFVLLIFAWSTSVALILLVPDIRIMQNFAYAFMLYFDLFDWPVVHQILCIAGGFLWGTTALTFQRRTREACMKCGRTDAGQGAAPVAAIKWGKWVTYIAVVTALPYGLVRLTWAAGIPIGVSDPTAINTQTLSESLIEAVLGILPICGAILTLGLIQRWGEIFPRWCVFLAGKRVPIWFAVIPAALASVMLIVSGLKLWIHWFQEGSVTRENWGELGPGLFWLPWGISLGVATLAYYLRRRSSCKHCGRREQIAASLFSLK
ncbi:ribosomal protein S14/uncharacterized membrane protein YeaQ/YmgE (transglycosylase-associated protein family) [Paenibacillus mucilaginosus]|uniref:hypothetical protein n=1 Tax=Paenibacillus mucilaginosus TaxID=61624 RepID=UPI003D246804